MILFVVTSAPNYRLQLIFAEYLVKQGRKIAFVYDAPPDDFFSLIQSDAARLGALVMSLDTEIHETHKPAIQHRTMPKTLRSWICSFLALKIQSPYYHSLSIRLGSAQRLLKEIAPKIVIVGEDGISGPAAIIAAAYTLKIPILDLPYGCGIEQDLEVALEEKKARNELINVEGWLGRLIKFLAPEWVKRRRFKGALIFPPEYIIAREALGMTLRNGWIVHGGYANRLLVESNQMMGIYRSERINSKKLILTGTPYCDLIQETLNQCNDANTAFRKPVRVHSNKLNILVSWPPSYHASRAAKCEFETYEEMTKQMLSWLNSLPDCNVTVSLHPAIQAESRKVIEQLGLNISNEYIVKLIPKHDIFVSYYSSVIRWAIASGKPVVNYDAYGLKLNLFKDAPAFFDSSTFDEFQKKILTLTCGNTFAYYAKKQSDIAEQWGIVDGKSMDKIMEVMDSLSV